MIGIAMNLLTIMILVFFAWSGYKKGLILSVASLLIFFVSVMAGMAVASQYTEKTAANFDELLSWVADDATEAAITTLKLNVGTNTSLTNTQMKSVSALAFENLGVHKAAAEKLAVTANERYKGKAPYQTISLVFIRALAWVALFFVGFLITNLLLSLIINFVSELFTLPNLKVFDIAGGAIVGLFTGIMIMGLVGMGIRYAGIVLPDSIMAHAGLLKTFMNSTPFGGIVNIK